MLRKTKYLITTILILSGCFQIRQSYETSSSSGTASAPVKPVSAGQETIRFIAVGDTGTGGPIQYSVAKAMEDKCKKSGCDFGIILGDNIYNSGVSSVDDPQFKTKFEDPYKNLDFRFYLTLGNHDYRGNVQAEIDYTKKSKKWYMPGRTYHFSRGPADFFSIDTDAPSEAQVNELTKEINNSKAKWKIVFGHHPRYTNGVYENATGELQRLLDKPLCGKADLYLCGHEHDKQHLKKACGVEYLIVGTGGGVRTKLRPAPNSLFAKATPGFSWFEIDQHRMHFEILDAKGNIEYQYSTMK